MKEGEMLKIKVPGSTANLGPGFDSIGLALSRYLILTVALSDSWFFEAESPETSGLPEGKENLIYQVAERTAAEYGGSLPSCHVKVWSDIPVARGLGSSAAAIVAGVELADALCGLALTLEEKARLASLEEEHPDNAGASVYGGMVIGLHQKDETSIVHLSDFQMDPVVVIPSYKVFTKDARDVLPASLPFKTAVEAGAVGNMLVAAFMTGNWKLAGKMMEKDLLHQPYRGTLTPELELVADAAKEAGAYGTALSGAGPAVICFAKPGDGPRIAELLRKQFAACHVDLLFVPSEGSTVEHFSSYNHSGSL
ncbi:homoserine kinase [Metabacillus sp. KIGAM252]|uniref:Homoserine kinase n=1 Tax=Metabacillus flavus TaxID=2823519 RepID=A0ABS5LIF5_9BACI|nr:homoserine kinase [Metabacillus flavus]MBS2970401.1 homoserine kinase [Metabacillus flavus]